jgi:hypothetical protein
METAHCLVRASDRSQHMLRILHARSLLHVVIIHSAVLEGTVVCAEVLAAADSLLSQGMQLNLCVLVLVCKQVIRVYCSKLYLLQQFT